MTPLHEKRKRQTALRFWQKERKVSQILIPGGERRERQREKCIPGKREEEKEEEEKG